MALSFCQLLESMKDSDQLTDDKSVDVVRSGININDKFWDEFIQVCGNADGLATLLDVPRHKVAGWASKIYDVLEKIHNDDDQTAATAKAKSLDTGNPD